MAWEWSHTPEAYSDAYDNLHAKPHDWLAECMAEWNAQRQLKRGNVRRYDKSLAWAKTLRADTLADAIWERASSWESGRTCDNGGFNAWVCPFGCHTVPFSCPDEE